MPWTGGINDSADPGAIPSNDLVRADNIINSTSGARIKRPGFAYVDDGDIPAVTSISRSGTTVTVVFASNVNDGTNNKLVVGEKITLVSSNSAFNVTDVAIATIPANDTITYSTAASGTIAAGATVTSLVRSSTIIGTHDFWYYDSTSNTKQQLILALTSQGKLFKYTGTASATRLEITKKTYAVTATAASPGVFTLNSHGFYTGTALTFTGIVNSGAASTTVAIGTTYYVEKNTADANTFWLADTIGGSRKQVDGSTLTTGTFVAVPFGLTLPINTCDFKTYNEKCFISCDGLSNWPIMFDPVADATTYTFSKGANPNASVMQIHEGRLIMNDKFNRDGLHYSAPYDHTKWQGHGASGRIDIGIGDGDPDGIVSILPPFKGALFVSKAKSMYRLPDPGIAFSRVENVSKGIAAISHRGAASVDLDDVFFIGPRGFHSLAATNTYGDFSSTFLSDKIQNAFYDFTNGRKPYTSGQYYSPLNLVVWSISQDSATSQDMLWVYNTKFKEWSRWTGLAPSCVTIYKTTAKDRLLIATTDCRLAYLTEDTYSDFDGEKMDYYLKTGKIYVDNNPNSVKAFKRIGFIFPPKGSFNFTVAVKIDNQPLDMQFPDGTAGAGAFTVSKTSSGDLLGSTFILGQSLLSYTANLDPFMRTIDGVGRGITVTITNNAAGEQVEIYGIIIEYVPAGVSQETYISGDDTE
jgi:hypothetical protein